MPRTVDFYGQIAAPCLPQATDSVDHGAALDTPVDMLDARPSVGDAPILRTEIDLLAQRCRLQQVKP